MQTEPISKITNEKKDKALVNLVRLAFLKASFLLWLNLVLYCNKQLVCGQKSPLSFSKPPRREGVHGFGRECCCCNVVWWQGNCFYHNEFPFCDFLRSIFAKVYTQL